MPSTRNKYFIAPNRRVHMYFPRATLNHIREDGRREPFTRTMLLSFSGLLCPPFRVCLSVVCGKYVCACLGDTMEHLFWMEGSTAVLGYEWHDRNLIHAQGAAFPRRRRLRSEDVDETVQDEGGNGEWQGLNMVPWLMQSFAEGTSVMRSRGQPPQPMSRIGPRFIPAMMVASLVL